MEENIAIDLPDEVRQAFANNNGLLGPTGIWLLFPRNDDSNDDIVRLNKNLKSEDWFPAALKEYAFIGSDGCGGLICTSSDGRTAAIWNPADGEHFHEQKSSVGEIWDLIRRLYTDSEAQLDEDEIDNTD